MAIDLDQRAYFKIADHHAWPFEKKLKEYFKLAEQYFQADRFKAFCDKHLGHVDAVAHEYFASKEFDDLLVRTVRESFPAHEHDRFAEHYRTLMSSVAPRRDLAATKAEPVKTATR